MLLSKDIIHYISDYLSLDDLLNLGMFSDDMKCGYIVLDKYPGRNPEWNLELMKVIPERHGYGSILLNHVMHDMKVDLSVCVTTDESRAFFKKHGMTEKGILYYNTIDNSP